MKFLLEVEVGGCEYWSTNYYSIEGDDKETLQLELMELVQKQLNRNLEYERLIKEIRDLREKILTLGKNHKKYPAQYEKYEKLRIGLIEKMPQETLRYVVFCGHKFEYSDFVHDNIVQEPVILTIEEFWQQKLPQ